MAITISTTMAIAITISILALLDNSRSRNTSVLETTRTDKHVVFVKYAVDAKARTASDGKTEG